MSEAEKAGDKPAVEEGAPAYGGTGMVADLANSADMAQVWREVRTLGLENHVAELEATGYTVVPPEKVAPPEFVNRLRVALARVTKRRLGGDVLDDGGDTDWIVSDVIEATPVMTYLLFEEPEFQEAAVNPVALALADYALGRSCLLSACNGIVKGPGAEDTFLHTDTGGIGVPEPYPHYPLLLNCTWVLTDYTRADGALCLVPGSHRKCRAPMAGEGIDARVPIEVPSGSLVVWNGQTWHGAFRRENPGIRLTLVLVYSRAFVMPMERYREEVPADMLKRNPPRFAALLGANQYLYGYKEGGPDREKLAIQVGRSWWR